MPGAGDIKAGAAYVELGLKDAALRSGLAAVQARVKTFGLSITAIGAGLAGLGAAITGPLIGFAKSFAEEGTALLHMSQRTGFAVESLSQLGYAAMQTGMDLDTVEVSLRKMQKLITAAALGVPTASMVFNELGISVKALQHLKPEQQFEAIARTIAKIHDPTARAAAAMLVFGRSGTMIIPLIEHFAELNAEAREWGLVKSQDSVEKAEKLNKALKLLDRVMTSIWKKLGAAIAPALTDMAMQMAHVAKRVGDWVKANQPLIEVLFRVGSVLGVVGTALVATSAVITGVGAAFAFILNPITLTVAGLAGLTYWFVTSTQAGRDMAAFLKDAFDTLLADTLGAVDGISDALAAGSWTLAAKVGWAFVKVEFIRGWNFLKETGGVWALAAIDTFEHWRYRVLGIAADVWAALQVGFIDLSAILQTFWIKGVAFFKSAWADGMAWLVGLVGNLGKVLAAALKAFFTGGDASGYMKAAMATAAKAKKEIAGETEGDTAAVGAGADERKAGVERDRVARRAQLETAEAAGSEARRKALEAMTTGDAEALDKALSELNDAEIEARDARLKAEGGKTGKKATTPDVDIGAGVDSAMKKVDAAGTFSAFAAKGMAIGASVAEDQLKEAKKTNALLEKSIRGQEAGGAFFGAD